MVSFTAAVTALLAVVSTTNGFTSYTSNKRSASTILQSTTSSESYQFQRSLLEAQLSNSASIRHIPILSTQWHQATRQCTEEECK